MKKAVVSLLIGSLLSAQVFAQQTPPQAVPAPQPAATQQEAKQDAAEWLVSKAGAWFIGVGPYAGYRLMTDGQGNFSLSLAVTREMGKQYAPNMYGTVMGYGFGTVVMNAVAEGRRVSWRVDVKKVDAMDLISEAYDASGQRFSLSTK